MNQPTAPTLQTFNQSSLGSNPWDKSLGQDQATAQQMQSMMPQGAGSQPGGSGAYPAMSNQYNLGSQTPAAPPAQGAINTTVPGAPTATNPWQYQGDSNARGEGSGAPPPPR